jgi:hypothetical protein
MRHHTFVRQGWSSLYVGDLARGLMGLIRAEGEFHALTRYQAPDELADAIIDIAETVTLLVDEAKWIQGQLRGFEWEERPTLRTAA